VADLVRDGAHSRIGLGSRSQSQFQNGSLIGSPSVKPLEISDVSKDHNVVRPVHHALIDTGDVEVADLDLFSDKIGQQLVTYLEAEQIGQTDRNRDSQFHGIRFLSWSPFEQHAVDALPFLDDSSAVNRRSDALHLRNRLYVRHETLVDRNRRRLADVVHVHRHQLHVSGKVGNSVPDLVPEP